jgi:hypothetical protein
MGNEFEGFKVNQKVRLNRMPLSYRGDNFIERMFTEGVIGEVVAYNPQYRMWRVEFPEGGYGNFLVSELTEVDDALVDALGIDTPEPPAQDWQPQVGERVQIIKPSSF